MPVETRPDDLFTRDNLLIGFPVVEFTPALSGGGYGTPVQLGILSGFSLQKTVELLQLPKGDSGLITIDRELVKRLEVSFNMETFNFRADLARYVFASSSISAVTADAAAAVANDPISLPIATPFDAFLSLSRGAINEASFAVQFATISDEAVGTGNGSLGGTQGDFALNSKIKAVADITSLLVGGVEKVSLLVAGSTPTSGQIAVEIGEQDSSVTGSGAITFGSAQIPANGAAIVATYTPSFTTAGGDIVALTDFTVDPVLGRIRFRHAAADTSPFRLATLPAVLDLVVDYTYVRSAHSVLVPFTQNVFEGKARVRQLTDIGTNLLWAIPSASIRITDDELAFGADDFATATLQLNVLNAGGTEPYGTIEISSESEAA